MAQARTLAGAVRIPSAPPEAALLAVREAIVMRARGLIGLRLGDAGADTALLAATAELTAARSALRFPIDQLLDAVKATELEREAVFLAAAAHLDEPFRQALGRLRGVSGLVDVGAVVAIVGGDNRDELSLSDRLGPEGRLVRAGLIDVAARVDGALTLLPTARLLGLLRGEVVLDPRVRELAELRRAEASDGDGVIDAAELAALIPSARALLASGNGGHILITGPVGRGHLVSALAASLGHGFVLDVDCGLLPRGRELAASLRLIEREAAGLGAMVLLDGVDVLLAGDRTGGFRAQLARRERTCMLTAAGQESGPIDELIALRVSLRRPGPELRLAAWRRELERHRFEVPEAELQSLAEDYPLTRESIATALDLASASPNVGLADMRSAAEAQVHSRLSEYAERMRPRAKLATLVLPTDTHEQVHEIVNAVRSRTAVLQRWAGSPIVVGNGIAAMFNGPPGTGKTMTAGVIANELGVPMYRIDVASIVDRYVGETEKNLSRVFEEAESDRAMLLFDEADSLFSKRVEVKDATDRYANMQVNLLLNLIEGYRGFVVLTTNLKNAMDTAFLRRIAFKVQFELPEEAERLALWRMHLPGDIPVAPDVDLAKLAREFKTTGEKIRNVVFRAALMTGGAQPITDAMLRRAMRGELEAAGNVVRHMV